MIEACAGPTPDISKLRIGWNMRSSLDAKWSDIPANYQHLIETEIDSLYQREVLKEKTEYGVKDLKEYKNIGLLVPSDLMVELIVTLADLDYKNASGILSSELAHSPTSAFKKTDRAASAAGIDLDQ